MASHDRYLILKGGAGSGKSVFASQKILSRAFSENRHRFLVVKKVAKTLRQSVFRRITNEIDSWGLRHHYEIKDSDMNIRDIASGSEFIFVGLDDHEKLQSIEGITGIWAEEATDFTESDFDQLDLRLRGETEYYKQIILTFNPIDENHWLKKRFFDNTHPNSLVLETTFKDNNFIDEDYITALHNKIITNPHMYNIYVLGEWGRDEVGSPYAHNFDDKHISAEAVYNPNLPVIFSLDFNVEPFVCLALHIWRDDNGEHLHVFDEIVIEKNGSVPEMCNRIENQFGKVAMFSAIFTGDAMQRKREITQQDNIDAWRIIANRFHANKRVKVPRANPRVKENRHLVNAVFAFHPDIKINPKCKGLIYELRNVEADSEGNIIKKDRNKLNQRADYVDAFRYALNTFLCDFYERYKLK